MNKPKKYAIYARFSTNKQNPLSAEDQIALCKKWILKNDRMADIAIYRDNGMTGNDIHRPGLNKFLKDLPKKKFDVLVLESQDRLSRNQANTATIFEKLDYYDIAVYTLDQGWIDNLKMTVNGMVANMFLDQLTEKTKRGQEAAIERGILPINLVYGYKKNKDKKWCIKPKEAKTVKEIFEKYDSGASFSEIAHWMNDKKGNKIRWDYNRIRNLLGRKLYIGIFEYRKSSFVKNPDTQKKERIISQEGTHDTYNLPNLTIVDEKLFQTVQNKISKVNSFTCKSKKPKGKLFQGKLLCPCGCHLTFSKHPKKIDKYYLRCNQRFSRPRHSCKYGGNIDYDVLVENILEDLLDDIINKENIHKTILSYHNENVNNVYNSEKENIINMVHSEDNLSDLMKYLNNMAGENNIIDMNNIHDFLKENIAKYRTNINDEQPIRNLDVFIKSIVVYQRERYNSRDFDYKYEIDYQNITNNLDKL